MVHDHERYRDHAIYECKDWLTEHTTTSFLCYTVFKLYDSLARAAGVYG